MPEMPASDGVQRCLGRLLYAWEALQVELDGQYSPLRFIQLLEFTHATSPLSVALVALTFPLPCLLAIFVLEAMPLHPVASGLPGQTFGFWFRVSFSSMFITLLVLQQLRQCAPLLPMATTRMWTISLVMGLYCCASCYLLAMAIGFPIPFMLQLVTVPWRVMIGILLGIAWKSVLKASPDARRSLKRFLMIFWSQGGLIVVYMIYNGVFSSLSGFQQTLFALVLPMMKLTFKNLMHRGAYQIEDLAPVIIVFNIDVFHAVFVSSTMQQAASSGTTVVVMLIDTAQLAIAYVEIHRMCSKLHRLEAQLHRVRVQGMHTDSVTPAAWPSRLKEPRPSSRRPLLDQVRKIFEASRRVRSHSDAALPRHLRSQPLSLSRVSVLPHDPTPSEAVLLTASERLELELVKHTLRLLHMIEFYILIEFVEVVMAFIYCMYLVAMAFLPNRAFYHQLQHLSDEELASTTTRVAVYAVLELLSLVVFCVALRLKIPSLSSLHQLAFVLYGHWQMAQATLIMWVCYVIQLSLDHAGTDYSFKFTWLHSRESN